MNDGFFLLRTADDMLSKLQWELDNLRESPDNCWVAFNFFVTADHLSDWVGNKTLRKTNTLLRICSHLANGAKHFHTDRHTAIASVNEKRLWEGVFEEGVVEEWLEIVLEPKEAEEIGVARIDAVSLGERIANWWCNYLSTEWRFNQRQDRPLAGQP